MLPQWLSFLDMGKNSGYIWSAWAITVVSITVFICYSWYVRQRFYQKQYAALLRYKKNHSSNASSVDNNRAS